MVKPFVNGHLYNRQNTAGYSVHYLLYEPIHEWESIFTQVRVIQYSTDYGPIREWESVFTKLLQVIRYTVNYGPISKRASNLHQLRVYSC